MNQSDKIPVCNFIRVSTKKQDYERQITELNDYADKNKYSVADTIATKISGFKDIERNDIDKLISGAKQGKYKKVLVLEISRLGRKAKDIRSAIDKLHTYGVSVIFKNLGGIESLQNGKESFVTNIIIAIYSELAQEERRILVERICSGLEQAKIEGKKLGRKTGSIESKETLLKKYAPLLRDIKAGISLRKCMKIHDVSKNTIIKAKKLIY